MAHRRRLPRVPDHLELSQDRPHTRHARELAKRQEDPFDESLLAQMAAARQIVQSTARSQRSLSDNDLGKHERRSA
jgi:hypothetical protein